MQRLSLPLLAVEMEWILGLGKVQPSRVYKANKQHPECQAAWRCRSCHWATWWVCAGVSPPHAPHPRSMPGEGGCAPVRRGGDFLHFTDRPPLSSPPHFSKQNLDPVKPCLLLIIFNSSVRLVQETECHQWEQGLQAEQRVTTRGPWVLH